MPTQQFHSVPFRVLLTTLNKDRECKDCPEFPTFTLLTSFSGRLLVDVSTFGDFRIVVCHCYTSYVGMVV